MEKRYLVITIFPIFCHELIWGLLADRIDMTNLCECIANGVTSQWQRELGEGMILWEPTPLRLVNALYYAPPVPILAKIYRLIGKMHLASKSMF